MPHIPQPPWHSTLHASAARTADGQTTAVEAPLDLRSLTVYVNTSAASGTSPTMDLNVETSYDGGTTYWTIGRFAQITTTGKRRLTIPLINDLGGEVAIGTTGGSLAADAVLGRHLRLNYDIGGTSPSFTFVAVAVGDPVGRASTSY